MTLFVLFGILNCIFIIIFIYLYAEKHNIEKEKKNPEPLTINPSDRDAINDLINYSCNICNINYPTSEYLSKHVKNNHSVTSQNIIESKAKKESKLSKLFAFGHKKNQLSNVVDDKKECIVCMNEKINTILIPCFHMELCSKCANSLTECCTCRKKITQRHVVYSPLI